jgi:uncharacterized protein YegL
MSQAVADDISEPIKGKTSDISCEEVKMLVILDRSGSMDTRVHGTRPIRQAREAVVMVAELMEPGDYLGLVVFNDKAKVTVDLTPNSRKEVADEARGMKAEGGTSFNAGLRKAVHAIEDASARGVHVVFISDGDDRDRLRNTYIRRLQDLDVHLNTIATGREANHKKLKDLSSRFGGWSLRVQHSSLKSTLAEMVNEARCQRTVADIRDVIRPTETQEFGIYLNGTGEEFQFTGTWDDGDLSFSITSPSGTVYNSDEHVQDSLSVRDIEDTYRVLRLPSEEGYWRFQVEARSASEQGEAYRFTIATMEDEGPRLVPLSDYQNPGHVVEVTLADCAENVKGTLYEKGEATTKFDFTQEENNTCVAWIDAPGMPGLFPVAIQPEDGHRLWTTLIVGYDDEVIKTRDEWRPEEQPWSEEASSDSDRSRRSRKKEEGGSLLCVVVLIILLAGTGVVIVVIRKRDKEEGQEEETGEVELAGTDEEPDDETTNPHGIEPETDLDLPPAVVGNEDDLDELEFVLEDDDSPED